MLPLNNVALFSSKRREGAVDFPCKKRRSDFVEKIEREGFCQSNGIPFGLLSVGKGV